MLLISKLILRRSLTQSSKKCVTQICTLFKSTHRCIKDVWFPLKYLQVLMCQSFNECVACTLMRWHQISTSTLGPIHALVSSGSYKFQRRWETYRTKDSCSKLHSCLATLQQFRTTAKIQVQWIRLFFSLGDGWKHKVYKYVSCIATILEMSI